MKSEKLEGMELKDVVIYKGKAYYGRMDGDKLFIRQVKSLFGSVKEKELKYDKIAFMSEHVYKLLIKNTSGGKVEKVGMLGGRKKGKILEIKYVINFLPAQIAPKGIYGSVAKAAGGGYGTILASEEVNRVVKSRGNIIGFYHSHPTNDRLSPGDKKEFKKAAEFDGLKTPIKFHILCRRSGFHRALSKYVLLPMAYYKKGIMGSYEHIPIMIKG